MRSLILLWLLASPPDVAIEPTVRDLGEVRGGAPAACSFEIVNRGAAPVDLLDLERSCGCVEPTFSKKSLEPGERATLSLKIRTLGQPEGTRSWPLTLVMRSGATISKRSLEVKTSIRNEIVLQPPQLALYVNKTVEQEITLVDRRDRPLRVASWNVTAAGAMIEQLSAPPGTTRLKLTVDGSRLAPGRHESTIRLLTDDPQYASLEIPLTLVRTTPVKVVCSPETPEVVIAAGQKKGSVLLTLRRSDGEPLSIDAATGVEAGVTCTHTVSDDGRGFVRVSVEREAFRGMIQTGVRIAAGADTIAIPILVRIE